MLFHCLSLYPFRLGFLFLLYFFFFSLCFVLRSDRDTRSPIQICSRSLKPKASRLKRGTAPQHTGFYWPRLYRGAHIVHLQRSIYIYRRRGYILYTSSTIVYINNERGATVISQRQLAALTLRPARRVV